MVVGSKRPVRTKKTREEVQHEFQEIEDEFAKADKAVPAAEKARARAREEQVRAASQELGDDAVVHRLTSLGVEVSRTLGGLAEKLVSEVNLLATVREAVTLEHARMVEIHKIDVVATTLEQLIDDHRTKRGELEAERTRTQAEWAAHEADRAREQREYDDALKKQRTRERDEYEYQKALERKKADDGHKERTLALDRVLVLREEEAARTLKAREDAVATAETELARLRQDVSEFPKRLEDDSARAVAKVAAEAAAKHEQVVQTLKMQADADRRVGEFRIQSLESAAVRLEGVVAALQQKLDESNRQVQQIAVKAIEGASGAQALLHVNKIAMEQAKKNQPS